jgi:cytochrome d ubiquinol oxidase subunit II
VLWGVAWANILRGVPIDPQHRFIGSLAGLLNPYALWAGLTTAALFTLHGAVYLTLRTDGEVLERSRAVARRIAWPAAIAVAGFLVWTYVNAERAGYRGLLPPLVPVAAMGAVIAVSWLLQERLEGWDFVATAITIVATAITIVLVTATIFLNLYPRVMVSSLGAPNSLTIDNAASGHSTLRLTAIVAAIFTPLVLAYQGWTCWCPAGASPRASSGVAPPMFAPKTADPTVSGAILPSGPPALRPPAAGR